MKRCVICNREFQDYEDCPVCLGEEEYFYLPKNIDIGGSGYLPVRKIQETLVVKYNLNPGKVARIKYQRK